MNNFNDINHFDADENFDLKKEFLKYFFYWKYFAITLVSFFLFGFLYLRYTPKVYQSNAKIKILDKKETSLEMPTASDLFAKSKINLENEIEILKSQPILREVVKNLRLQNSIYQIGDIMNSLTVDYPFDINYKVPIDSINKSQFKLTISNTGFEIIDFNKDDLKYSFDGSSTFSAKHDLPFDISNFNKGQYIKNNFEGYLIEFNSLDDVVGQLKETIEITRIGKESDVINLSFLSTNYEYSNNILNELIDVFNIDGIQDRQFIHKRTIDFVNNRYAFLSLELDSIEVVKQLYKIDNDLVDLTTNSSISVQKSFKSEEKLFDIETQISITKFLESELSNIATDLLPANLGIENSEVNSLINEHNKIILERKKLILSAGINNPSIRQLDDIIDVTRLNITVSLQNYLSQLESLSLKLSNQSNIYNTQVSDFPENEKILRSIERNQQIKEALYLFLLQKREEAEVSYAVTEPSLKIVENAYSDKKPKSPKSSTIYLSAFLLGLILPFGVLYIMFLFDTKLHSKNDLINLNLKSPIIAEIPENDGSLCFVNSKFDRSQVAESFRVLSSNLNFVLKSDLTKGEVIFSTSTVKGEGKTFTAFNLALTYSSLDKKVLLIGADLRNPQLHKYLNVDKSITGLTNYLTNKDKNWRQSLVKFSSKIDCDILLAGAIPPNPTQLLNNGNLENLIEEAKNEYDFIIIDTPPALLVSDTLSIVNLSDLVLYVTRCEYSDLESLNFLKDLEKDGKIKNLALVINAVNNSSSYGYSYNYGYGYGYESDQV